MFLKKLRIQNKEGIIREIVFRKGMNLIVDETPENQQQQTTGNNVGKTTLLRLIDYCLGAKGEAIYKDIEFITQPNTQIEDFLLKSNVLLSLEIVEDFESDESNKIYIERNFLKRNQKVQTINGVQYKDDKSFCKALKQHFFDTDTPLPSFRQIISKNIRITPERMINIVKVLGTYARGGEYEALYLFWLGLSTASSAEKTKLLERKKEEKSFQRRLIREGGGDIGFVEQQLQFHTDRIAILESEKADFNLNEQYNTDIEELNQTKVILNSVASEISVLEERKALILESKTDLEAAHTHIDTIQIAALYEKAKALIPTIQVSFEQTVKFHNDLIAEKLAYITRELPDIEQQLRNLKNTLALYRKKEIELTEKVKKIGVWESIEKIVSELNNHYERKGNLEKQKEYWLQSIDTIKNIDEELAIIDKSIGSEEKLMQNRITLFNKYFSRMSELLYGEHYLLFHKKMVTI